MRILLFIVACISVLYAPWWLTLLFVFGSSLRYQAWEMLFIGLCMDFLTLPPELGLHSIPVFTLASLAFVWGFDPIRAEFMSR
jgi:hypothetical protein